MECSDDIYCNEGTCDMEMFTCIFFVENLICCGPELLCLSGWFCVGGELGKGVC